MTLRRCAGPSICFPHPGSEAGAGWTSLPASRGSTALSISRDAKSRCQRGLHRLRRGGSTPPSRRVWVANFDSEVPALNRRELGANPRQPTISASVVKLLSSFASNEEFAGGNPAGCTSLRAELRLGRPIYAALAQLPEALRSERRGWGWKSLTRHHFAHVVQRRDGALKARTVPVQTRPWALVAVRKDRV